jgi:hypothetical protein
MADDEDREDLAEELIEDLPPKIAEALDQSLIGRALEALANGPMSPVRPGARPRPSSAYTQEDAENADLYGATQRVIGAVGQVFPGFTEIANAMGTVRSIAEAFANLQDVFNRMNAPPPAPPESVEDILARHPSTGIGLETMPPLEAPPALAEPYVPDPTSPKRTQLAGPEPAFDTADGPRRQERSKTMLGPGPRWYEEAETPADEAARLYQEAHAEAQRGRDAPDALNNPYGQPRPRSKQLLLSEEERAAARGEIPIPPAPDEPSRALVPYESPAARAPEPPPEPEISYHRAPSFYDLPPPKPHKRETGLAGGVDLHPEDWTGEEHWFSRRKTQMAGEGEMDAMMGGPGGMGGDELTDAVKELTEAVKKQSELLAKDTRQEKREGGSGRGGRLTEARRKAEPTPGKGDKGGKPSHSGELVDVAISVARMLM